MATLQVRNTATIGGNIAGANPCADMPPVLMVLDATATLMSANGQRTVPLCDIITGPRETVLQRDELRLRWQAWRRAWSSTTMARCMTRELPLVRWPPHR
jgi:CO/xanthine dehydrogenase FAD-binding subunit